MEPVYDNEDDAGVTAQHAPPEAEPTAKAPLVAAMMTPIPAILTLATTLAALKQHLKGADHAEPGRKGYWDKSNFSTYEMQEAAVRVSATLYVGNLDTYTSEQQIYELFRRFGPVKSVIMGLHRVDKTPCGFCFVEFFERQAALDALILRGWRLDDHKLELDVDPGFKEGRQYGRGRQGGQVRSDVREPKYRGGGYGYRHDARPSSSRPNSIFANNALPPTRASRPMDNDDDVPYEQARLPPPPPPPPPPMSSSSYGGYDRRSDERPSKRARSRGSSRDRRYTHPSSSEPTQLPQVRRRMVDEFGRDVELPSSRLRLDEDDD